MVDRFRSLPMARGAVLFGRALADMLSALSATVIVVAGLIVGWRIHGASRHAIAGFLILLFAFAMSWVGDRSSACGAVPRGGPVRGFIVVFPLTFLANTFVPTRTSPRVADGGGLGPISAVVASVRDLFGNPTGRRPTPPGRYSTPIPVSLAWCVAILAVCVPVAMRRYRLATAR